MITADMNELQRVHDTEWTGPTSIRAGQTADNLECGLSAEVSYFPIDFLTIQGPVTSSTASQKGPTQHNGVEAFYTYHALGNDSAIKETLKNIQNFYARVRLATLSNGLDLSFRQGPHVHCAIHIRVMHLLH